MTIKVTTPESPTPPPPHVASSWTHKCSALLTHTAAFGRLTRWAFQVCDADGTGHINQTELYAGILLVHVNLAKYAGAAACYPPTRRVCDDLFAAADADASGYIEQGEFLEIVQICSMDIAARMIVYYGILIAGVPYLADGIVSAVWHVDDAVWGGWWVSWQEHNRAVQYLVSFVSWKEMADRIVSMALFFLVIPMLFDAIDKRSKHRARKTKSP